MQLYLMNIQQIVANETKEIVQKEEQQAVAKARETKEIADSAQRDLNEALPALDAALASLKSLNRNDVVEVSRLLHGDKDHVHDFFFHSTCKRFMSLCEYFTRSSKELFLLPKMGNLSKGNQLQHIRLKYLTYKMAFVRSCVRVCAVEIKPGMLRALMMYAFGRAYGLLYKMATFHSKKGLFNTVYC